MNFIITDDKRTLFNAYAAEFEKKYLLEPKGQKHHAMYKKEREEVAKYWSDIKTAKQENKNITDLVLEKLLPYSNTRHNRDKGYRISVAPAITKDLKKWFENVGWHQPDDWDNIAKAIFDLFYGLIEKGDWQSLTNFEKNKSLSKGFKAGFITPTLYFLNPQYRILNNKTVDTINYLFGKDVITRDLTQYRKNLEVINNAIEFLDIAVLKDPDIFDAFCHWMCDKRLGGYARLEKTPSDEGEMEEAPPSFDNEIEPKDHWEAIYYLIKTGNALGYKTYVADPSRMAFGEKLGGIATLIEVPPILKSAPEVSRVDAIWYKPMPPFFLFEVEDGGTMREALHRLYNAMAFDARFFIVSPSENRPKFEKWVTTAPFKEFEERYNFRTYEELFNFYKEVLTYTSMKERFLRL